MTDPTATQGPAAPDPNATSSPEQSATSNVPPADPRDAQIAELQRQLDAAQAANTRSVPTDQVNPEDPNDTAGTTKTPPEVGAVVDHVYFDHYDPTTPGGTLVHQEVAVVAIEHDDQDRVIGARVMPVEALPLIPLAHLRY